MKRHSNPSLPVQDKTGLGFFFSDAKHVYAKSLSLVLALSGFKGMLFAAEHLIFWINFPHSVARLQQSQLPLQNVAQVSFITILHKCNLLFTLP
jgi:hypothetical protein